MAEKTRQLYYFNYSFFRKILLYFLYKNIKNKHRLLFDLSYYINLFFLGKFIYMYNGRFFKKMKINMFFLCLRFGNFSFTRRYYKFITNSKMTKLMILQKKR